MFRPLSNQGHAAGCTRYLDVQAAPGDIPGLWNFRVDVFDPDPTMSLPPYLLPNATTERLTEEVERWSAAHAGDDGPLPVFLSKAAPQILA
ncbi:MAG TPA: hypothetical protein VHX61_00920 [Rhizomicrobium sp.]|jgi:hypothetical protein|nr:hypothetical protein [Rhizomicrobium sp.]